MVIVCQPASMLSLGGSEVAKPLWDRSRSLGTPWALWCDSTGVPGGAKQKQTVCASELLLSESACELEPTQGQGERARTSLPDPQREAPRLSCHQCESRELPSGLLQRQEARDRKR